MTTREEVMKQVGEAMADVLVPAQRATLEREDGRVFFNLDNIETLCGIRIGPCPGCDECRAEGAQHLQFTAYKLKRKGR